MNLVLTIWRLLHSERRSCVHVVLFSTLLCCASLTNANHPTDSSGSELSPQNVLVLYNGDNLNGPGSQIAKYYQLIRPGAHSIPIHGLNDVLSGSTGEEISAEDYLTVILPQVQQGIKALEGSGESIDVIVTTKGMPLLVNSNPGEVLVPDPIEFCSQGIRQYSSLESELTRIGSYAPIEYDQPSQEWIESSLDRMRGQYILSGFHELDTNFSSNPYFDTNGPFVREGSDPVNGDIHLTSRLDGYTVQAVKRSLDRAQRVFVGSQNSGHVVVVDDDLSAGPDQMVDINPGGPGAGLVAVLDSAQRLKLYENTDEAITDLMDPDTGENLGKAIGYVSHGTNDGSGGLEEGYISNQLDFQIANGAIFLTHESFNARSFSSGHNQSQGLVAEWLGRGGAAALGHVEESCNGPDNVANEDLLFDMMLPVDPDQPGSTGMTFVEAAWNATRQLSYVNTVVGDPLMVWQTWLPGDINFDGTLDRIDANLYVLALVDREAFDELGFGVDADVVGDLNGSGRFDFGDINAFLSQFNTTDPILGDFNNDGFVTHTDVNPLVLALVDRASYDAEGFGVDPEVVGDIDSSGSFDLGDLRSFLDLITTNSPLIGDMNTDGLLSDEDISPFILALTEAEAYEAQYPLWSHHFLGDVNEDGEFNFSDISAFKDLLAAAASSDSAQSVPEPGSAMLLWLGIVAFLLWPRRIA